MRSAAEAELAKTRGGVVLADEVYADADAAWRALEEILGDDEWFFDAAQPGMVDAAVFAYAHLVLHLQWEGRAEAAATVVRTCKGLVEHERRVRELCGW